MKVGSIVFIDEKFTAPVQTGIITRIEFDTSTGQNWFEVLCNDGQNHVIPGWLLSPGHSEGDVWKEGLKNLNLLFKNKAHLYKYNPQPVKLYI